MQSYRVRKPSVIGDVIDGEAIIVDLDSGSYFSADGFGAAMWSALDAGHDPETIAAALAPHLTSGDAGDAVQAFVAQLLESGLIEPGDPEPASGPLAIDTAQLSGAVLPAMLSRHTDMEDLIQIDPIHDVNEAGWPMRKVDMERAAQANTRT